MMRLASGLAPAAAPRIFSKMREQGASRTRGFAPAPPPRPGARGGNAIPGASLSLPDYTGEVAGKARTGVPYCHVLYRGDGLSRLEKGRDRIPAQFAIGEHWTPDPLVALSYGPKLRIEQVSLSSPYVFALSGRRPSFEDMGTEFGTRDPGKVTELLEGKAHDGLVVLNVGVMRGYSRAGSAEVISFASGPKNRRGHDAACASMKRSGRCGKAGPSVGNLCICLPLC